MFDLNEVKVFVSVVEAGSFVGGGQLLGLPSTTVSRKVQQLESALGVRLLNRSTRKLSLTSHGEIYFQQCRTFLEGIEAANQALQNIQAEPQGLIRITAPIDFADCYLQPLMASFMDKHPKIQLELLISDRVLDMIEHRVDVAFRSGVLGNSSLIARKLMDKHHVYCASPAYLETHGTPASPAELIRHNCIVDKQPGTTHYWRFKDAKDIVEYPVSGAFAADSTHLQIKASLAGMGIARLPEGLARFYLGNGSLVQLFGSQRVDAGAMYILYQSHKVQAQSSKLFIAHAIETLTRQND